MNVDEIADNLRNLLYRCVVPMKNDKPLKSSVWETWHWVANEEGDVIPDVIACVKCYTVQNYKSTKGTSNLKNHECINNAKRKSLAGRCGNS